MRANINLDTEAYNFASAYAAAKGIPLGAAVSELLKRVQSLPEPPLSSSPHLVMTERGFYVRAKMGRTVTPKMVKELAEDE